MADPPMAPMTTSAPVDDNRGQLNPDQVEDPDATEQSSSFGDTFSGSCESIRLDLSDAEVESRINGEDGDRSFSNHHRVFRKKRLTAHWRKFIRPLMWRCHWIELRMKALQSQALMYDRELTKCMHDKLLTSEATDLDTAASSKKKHVMKRRKRRRKEDTVDIPSYMSHHNIFSYYENKKSETDGHSVDDCADPGNDDNRGTDDLMASSEWLLTGSKGVDSSLEQILFAIESVQARVVKLKGQLSNLMSKNIKNDPSANGDILLGPPPTFPLSPSHSREEMLDGGLNAAASRHMSELDELEDAIMAGSTVSSFGDAVEVDIVESTIGLLSTADAHPNHRQTGEFSKDNADDVLISNQAAELELQVGHAIEKPQEVAKEEVESSFEDERDPPKPSTDKVAMKTETVDLPHQQQPAEKAPYTGKQRGRKPKRKRRGSQAVNAPSGTGSLRVYQRRKLS